MADAKQTVTPDPAYRLDPSRSIEVFGEFTENLANDLLPKINILRSGPDRARPITIYINSRGGLTRVLNILYGALTAKDQDDKSPRIITAASGDAASAAAYLLSYGNYAVAYTYSMIHFHGVRASEVELTAEDAFGVSKRFTFLNRETANRMARQMMGRLAHRYIITRTEVRALRKRFKAKKEEKTELECYIALIIPRMGTTGAALAESSLKSVKETYHLLGGVFGQMRPFATNSSQVRMDFRVLRRVISHDFPHYENREQELDDEGINSLMADYLALRDFAGGEHNNIISRAIHTWGAYFLSESDFKKYQKKKESKDEKGATDFLLKKARPKADQFFRFVVVLCRNLLKGENRLTATEAYWLGIVDEVAGTKLAGVRAIAERNKSDATTPPTAEAAKTGS